jgi:diguanylate cyclase (GGDEF)-like protein
VRERLGSLIQKMRAFENRLTVRQQIGLAAAALCLTLVAVLTAGATYMSRQQTSQLISDHMSNLARIMVKQLEFSLQESYRELQHFLSLEPLARTWIGPVGPLRELLEQVQENRPEYDWVGFITPDGKVRAATGRHAEGTSVAHRAWFSRSLTSPIVDSVQETTQWSQLDGDDTGTEPFRLIDIAFPVRSPDGRVLGVLAGQLSWQWAQDLRRRMLQGSGESPDVDLWILARDGAVLLGPELGERPFAEALYAVMRSGRFGTFVDNIRPRRMLTGYAVLGGHGDYRDLGWTVIARQPESVAFASARQLGWFIAGLGLFVATLGGVLALIIAGRIARPIQALTFEADRLGRDAASMMLPRQSGSIEVDHLSRALRSLLRRIGFEQQRSQEAELRSSENAAQFAHDLRALRKLADTDPLTNLMNRRAFLAAGADALEYFKRYDRQVGVLVIDIDHFKQVNDTHGHAAGDATIRRVGEIIEASVRVTDRAARFGGEEFVVLLREVDELNARTFADRMRVAVEAAHIEYGSRRIKVTVSIGVAIADKADRDINDTIERADRGLYMAKNTGRNRTFLMPLPTEQSGLSAA